MTSAPAAGPTTSGEETGASDASTSTSTPPATLPFPEGLYDTPGHAIASGLFVGVAATGFCWAVAAALRYYLVIVGRALWGIWARWR